MGGKAEMAEPFVKLFYGHVDKLGYGLSAMSTLVCTNTYISRFLLQACAMAFGTVCLATVA